MPRQPAWVPQCALQTDDAVSSVVITVTARSFLYHQIRLIVAWLVQVGSGMRAADETPDVLARKTPAAIGAKMAPATGLYLVDVAYDECDLSNWGSGRGNMATDDSQTVADPAGISAGEC